MLESLDLPFVQRGLVEVALLSAGAGVIGTWVVLRGLAFHSHAVGTAAFPGLVLADGLGFAAALGALGAAAAFAVVVALLPRHGPDRSSQVAVALVGMLALGVILASDVFESSAGLETLLFGSLLLIDGGELALAGAVSAVALAASALVGGRWLAHGFDAEGDGGGARTWLEPALLVLVALATAAAVTAVGALLVAALYVVPAATTRMWTSRIRSWQVATVLLCAVEGSVGVILAVELNAPPGATIAVLAGTVFALSAALAAMRRSSSPGSRLARWATAGTALLLLSGCGSDDGGDGLRVVATTPIAGDLAENVAGDEVEVTRLLDPNTDPHEYEPRPDDVEALASADLVVASGGDVDEWVGDAIAASGSEAELLRLIDVIEPGALGDDPHWWHDPRRAESAAAAIAEALGANARPYLDEIRRADRIAAACLRRVPASDRKLVTDHDSFRYLADRYDIEIVGAVIPATTTEAQASAGELAELRETIEREGVRAIFPEASVSNDLAATLAEETGASADHSLYGDSLGPDGSDAATYVDMITANAAALTEGLGGGAARCDRLGDPGR